MHPLKRLAKWSSLLSQKDMHKPIPDFIYPELNDVALLLKRNLYNEYKTIEREEEFLRYCSHELRTPTTTIKVSTQLLIKQIKYDEILSTQYMPIIYRISKATDKMTNVIVSLLWLSRKNIIEPAEEEINLANYIQDIGTAIINDFHYKCDTISKNIIYDLENYTLNIPIEPTKIIFDNLIRNALQFSADGTVHIKQRRTTVEIANTIFENNSHTEGGFGLGLELVKRLTAKLGWKYSFIIERNTYTVSIDLKKIYVL